MWRRRLSPTIWRVTFKAMGWGRWGFPLPPSSNAPSGRGLRMAQAAAQMDWQREAEAQPITQITHPKDVHDFIQSHPVLADTCHVYPRYLIAYAPQLTVRGYGGPFEEVIEAMYRRSVTQSERKRAANDPAGSGLTADGRHPGCDDEFVLRDPEFGMYGPAHIACGFVQGNSVASGPPVQYYAYIEYLAWMLSEASCWLPAPVRERLTLGMAEWPVWAWTEYEGRLIEEFGFEDQPFTGKFGAWLNKARLGDVPSLGSAAAMDVNHRMQFSSTLLKLPEDGATLAERFLAPEFLGVHLLARSRRGRQRLS